MSIGGDRAMICRALNLSQPTEHSQLFLGELGLRAIAINLRLHVGKELTLPRGRLTVTQNVADPAPEIGDLDFAQHAVPLLVG
jgi:hypothetical protein